MAALVPLSLSHPEAAAHGRKSNGNGAFIRLRSRRSKRESTPAPMAGAHLVLLGRAFYHQEGDAVEDSFARTVEQWRDFQALAGAVGATLLGLLFVAVSIRPAVFGRDTHPEFLSLALKSLGLFMLVVLIALLLVMTDPRPRDVGIALSIMGAISLFNSVPQLASVHRSMRQEWGAFFFLRRVLLPTAGYLLLLVAGLGILMGDTSWIHAIGWLQLVFLFTATYNAWDLVTHVAKQ